MTDTNSKNPVDELPPKRRDFLGLLTVGAAVVSTGCDKDSPSLAKEFAISLGSSTSRTIGSGGNYASINQALDDLLTYPPAEDQVILILLSGFVLTEQVIVRGRNLGWIEIVSEDSTVTIQRSTLTQLVDGEAPAFAGLDGAVLPTIGTLMQMDTSGSPSGKHGIYLSNNSCALVRSNCGITDAGHHGAYVINGSRLVANGAKFDRAGVSGQTEGRGIWGRYQAQVQFDNGSAVDCWTAFQMHASTGSCENATLTGAGHYGVRARRTSYINAQGAVVSNSAGHGVNCNEGSKINFRDGTAENCAVVDDETALIATEGSSISAASATVTGAGKSALWARGAATIDFVNGTASSVDPNAAAIRVTGGSTINADGATGSTNIPVNMLTNEGVIYDPDQPSPTGLVTIANHAVAELVPPRSGGKLTLLLAPDSIYPDVEASGDVLFDVGSSVAIRALSPGSRFNVSTSDVTGTTGPNGEITVAAVAGMLKIENRRGDEKTFLYSFV